jgi:hypothetical protein
MKDKERTEVKLISQERKVTTKGKEKVEVTTISQRNLVIMKNLYILTNALRPEVYIQSNISHAQSVCTGSYLN